MLNFGKCQLQLLKLSIYQVTPLSWEVFQLHHLGFTEKTNHHQYGIKSMKMKELKLSANFNLISDFFS